MSYKVPKTIKEGFPLASEILPRGLLQEEIIRKYPNHLHGKLLLDISATWKPKEISEIGKIKANTLVKRIRAARIRHDGEGSKKNQDRKKVPTSARNRRGKYKHRAGSHLEGFLAAEAKEYPPSNYNEALEWESEVSNKFRTEQEQIREQSVIERGTMEAAAKLKIKGKGRNERWYSEEHCE